MREVILLRTIELAILLNKKKSKKKWLHITIFTVCTTWCILEEMLFYDIPAFNNFFFHLSRLIDSMFLSVSCGYIFLYLTTVLPEHWRAEKMIVYWNKCLSTLSDELDQLLEVLLAVDNWQTYSDNDLRLKYETNAKNREIWEEICKCPTEYSRKKDIQNLDMFSLNAISFLFKEISETIETIAIFPDDTGDITYFRNLLLLKESKFFDKMKIFVDSAITQSSKSDMELESMRDTYLDHIIREELPVWLFADLHGNGNTCISVIRRIIECGRHCN